MNFSAIQSFPSKLYQDTIMIHCAKINDFPDMERSKNYSQSLYNIVQNEQAEIEQEETEIVNDLRAHQQTRKIGYILKKLTLVEEESLPIQVPLWPNQDLTATLTHEEAYKQYYRTQLAGGTTELIETRIWSTNCHPHLLGSFQVYKPLLAFSPKTKEKDLRKQNGKFSSDLISSSQVFLFSTYHS